MKERGRGDKKLKRRATRSSSFGAAIAKRSKSDQQRETPVDSHTSTSALEKVGKDENELNSKSVSRLGGELANQCLLLLASRQSVAVRGKVRLRPLSGSVDVLGHTLTAGLKTYQIFSTSTSSFLTITACSSDGGNSSERLQDIREVLKNHGCDTEKIKKALSRAREAASVVLLQQLTHPAAEFVCHYEPYCSIFSDTTGKAKEDSTCCMLTKGESALRKKTLDLGFQLLEPDCERFKVVSIPDQWNTVTKTIQHSVAASEGDTMSPTVLLCGGKDVGKSTFARYLVNKLLNRSGAVCFLECDVGQTEFTPPALLSLNKVTSPLLGPPLTHLEQPERSYFFGDVSPRDRPDYYIQCIGSLFRYYTENFGGKIPLVINTQGWVKGMGIPLLLDVIRISNPTHIVKFTSSQPTKNLPSITPEFLLDSPGWRYPVPSQDSEPLLTNDEELRSDKDDSVKENSKEPVVLELEAYNKEDPKNGSSYRASDHRTLALLSYFSGLYRDKFQTRGGSHTQVTAQDAIPRNFSAPLSSCVPYRVPWHSVAVRVLHTEVPRSQMLYSLNASVVGLSVLDLNQEKGEDKGFVDAPHFVQDTATAECVGLGIVRNIDPVNKLLYILTPVPLHTLDRVNLLEKGNLEIPASLLLQHNLSASVCHLCLFLELQKVANIVLWGKHTHAPYISSQFTYELRGAGARKVRYNLLRKKFDSPGHVSS